MRKELTRFNLIGRRFNQLAKFSALLVINGCLQILNLGCVLRTKTTKATSEIPAIQE